MFRRRILPPARDSYESYLGDVIGDPPIVRHAYPRQYDGPRWIELLTGYVLGWVAFAILIFLVGLFVVLSLMFAAQPSLAHGPAEWIQRGIYKNSAGELCCGERDCFEIADDDVKVTAVGYRVTLRTPTLQGVVVYLETVPFAEATPSPDGHYWRCQWGGKRKCFFAPPSAT